MKNKTAVTAILLIVSFAAVAVYLFNTPIELSAVQKQTLSMLIKIYLAASVYCILVSEISRNYSQVDKLWSILPIIYAWYVCYMDGFGLRTLICAALISVWGIRLSYNFAKKGGYSWIPWKGEEDYRWEVLRRKAPFSNKFFWSLFNIVFICFYQLGLILYFTIPVLLCMGTDTLPLHWIDFLAIGMFVVFFMVELVADKQQFEFQTEKYRRINEAEELTGNYKKGFIDTGLWSFARHPNYLGEQMMWLSVYIFGIAATGQWLNWTIGGIFLLVLLFRGSSDFSESISAEKYPEYKEYMNRVGRFFPKF